MARTGDKKAFCVLEFAKTESVVTVQWRFRTNYHTESPTDKTIREWYKKFQYSGCLSAAKLTDRPGPSVETVWSATYVTIAWRVLVTLMGRGSYIHGGKMRM
jgi:hypothetical protein